MIGDAHGRGVDYLRLSLTSACQMRCVYCRPARHLNPKTRSPLRGQVLEEMVRYLVEQHGLRKVRLTGGDPTARGDLLEIIKRLDRIDGLEELCMTTNGLTLARDAQAFSEAGLSRVNVSLDSLDSERFAALTGVRGLRRVLDGLHAAKSAGLHPKINAVVTRGFNEDELPGLVRFAFGAGLEIRFIELMPMGPLAEQWRDRYVPESEMRRILIKSGANFGEDLPQGSSAARRVQIQFDNGPSGEVGFITPMSCDFCSACTRLRIDSEGGIFPCLMDAPRGNLLAALVPRFDPQRFDALLAAAYENKAPIHPTVGVSIMTRIGG